MGKTIMGAVSGRCSTGWATASRLELPGLRRRGGEPAVFGSGRPFFATGGLAEPLLLENPTTIVQGDRVTHLLYDVRR